MLYWIAANANTNPPKPHSKRPRAVSDLRGSDSRCASQIQRVFRKYRDREVDFADACLIHLASEFHTGQILTLDHDFKIYRWSGNKPFQLLIPLS